MLSFRSARPALTLALLAASCTHALLSPSAVAADKILPRSEPAAPLLLSAASGQTITVPVREDLGLPRVNELVSLLVPFRAGAPLTSPDQLAILDDGGREIPAQWRVLVRWFGAPADAQKSIRYVLARFRVTVGAMQTRTYTVRTRTAADGPPAQTSKPILFEDQGGYVTIDTGPGRFAINRSGVNLFRQVLVDLDGNGTKDASEEIIATNQSAGSVLIDRFGGAYAGLADPGATLVVEEAGPLTVTLRVDGRHMPILAPHIGRDFLRFSTRYTFTAGSTAVRVQHVVRNDYLDQPLGNIGFARYLLHMKIKTSGVPSLEFGGDPGMPTLKPAFSGGNEVFLAQDSSAFANWNQPGTTFSGWRLYNASFSGLAPESYPAAAPLAAGDRAEGWMDIHDAGKGALIAMRYPWQNYPYALRSLSDGTVLFDLWPAEFAGLHWMDDAQRKMHDFTVVFHGTSGFDARLEALRQTQPLLPVVPLPYLQETRAWGDQGDIRDPKIGYDAMLAQGQNALAQKYDFMNFEGGFGWENFGEPLWAKNTHSAASPRNRLSYFDRFVSGGARPWFTINEIFALHSMDIRTYHIAGFTAEGHPQAWLTEGIPASNAPDKLGRDQLDPALDPHRAGIPDKGHGWNGYDSEHMVVDDIYEYYLLTGSQHALDALQRIGEGMLTWPSTAPGKEIPSSRTVGWSLRALMKICVVTGDVRFAQRAKTIIDNVEMYRGKKPSPVTGLVYHFMCRQIYGGGTHNMTSDYDLPWQMCVGIYGIALYARETQDFSVLPIIVDVSNYMLDYCMQSNGVFHDAIDVENHNVVNSKLSNDGVNTWMASAFGLAYRVTGKPELLLHAKEIFDANTNSFSNAGDYYHWYHTVGVLLGK